MSKTPEKVNLGGLWLMNPHSPQCSRTNLEGLRNSSINPDGNSLRAGAAAVMPAGFVIDVPTTSILVTGNTEVTVAGTEFAGVHILRKQPVTAKDHIAGSVGHPRYLEGDQLGNSTQSERIVHVAWYDSIKYAERIAEQGAYNSTIRNYYWSLYYGDEPQFLGPSIGAHPAWYLVSYLNPGTDPFDGNVGRWSFYTEWVFSHPLEDAGLAPKASGVGVADFANEITESAQVRFNPLGNNVFRRVGSGGFLQESITVGPHYG